MARLRRRAAIPAGVNEAIASLDVPARRRLLQKFYRYQGPFVEQYVFWKLRTDPLFPALDRATPDQGHIFDAGCGYGLTMHWLALGDTQRTLEGLDHDAIKIHVARASARGSTRLKFSEGDLLATPWPVCDTVLLCDVLHYFPRDLKAHILRKAFAALRPGGSLIMRDACGGTSAHRLVAWSERLAVWIGHNKARSRLHFETMAGYRSLLETNGFMATQQIRQAGLGSNVMLIALKPR